jgi:hypothetical protein
MESLCSVLKALLTTIMIHIKAQPYRSVY